MKTDWQVGDLAVCVALEHPDFTGRSTLLELGRAYHVTKVAMAVNMDLLGLALAEVRPRKYPDGGFPADMFRKIRPDEREACEPEFVTLLKRIRQKKAREHVKSLRDFYGDWRAA